MSKRFYEVHVIYSDHSGRHFMVRADNAWYAVQQLNSKPMEDCLGAQPADPMKKFPTSITVYLSSREVVQP